MKIWYVIDVYNDDDIISIQEMTFYSTEEKAQAECERLEIDRKIRCDLNIKKEQERWEMNELAIAAMEKIGIDWHKSGLLYHNRNWKPTAYKPIYEVRSLEVK